MIKATAYHLILNYACANLEVEAKQNKEIGYIKKHSEKIMTSLKMSQSVKAELVARLRNIKDICDNMTQTSHEMLAYIAINFLVNEEKDTTARGKFSHIDTNKKLFEWENKYKSELKEHLDFFTKVVDKL